MTELHVACASDASYLPHSAAMIHSAITAGGARIIHFLHGADLPRPEAAKLEGMVDALGASISFHEIASRRIAGLPVDNRFGPAMWYRIFVGELLSLDRVLYLDIDTLALDRLAPIMEFDISDVYLGAVRNVFMEFHSHRPRQVGIEASKYFNSGVLLLNLELMRTEQFCDRVVRLIAEDDGRMEWPDQDALNLAAAGRWMAMPPRWNCMNTLLTRRQLAVEAFGDDPVREAIQNPAIRHFEGPDLNKPWHLLHDRRWQQIYRQHRSATPWPDFAMEGRTLRNQVKRLACDLGWLAAPRGEV